MRICIVGAGAMGVMLGVRLEHAGHEVSYIDRPDVVPVIRAQGMQLINGDGAVQEIPNPDIRADYTFDRPFDYVILAVKAHQLAQLAPRLPSILAEKTAVMTVQNGIPWWYFQLHGGVYDGHRLQALDADGVIESHIAARRIVGCVAYPAAQTLSPGIVQHIEGLRFTLGELTGETTARCEAMAGALIGAGLKSYITDNIRAEIWLKAWGALSFNTISALTGATMEQICRFPPTRDLAAKMMAEAQVVANKLGIEFRHTIEKRIDGAEKVGAHKTSMLQDLEAGRKMEIEAVAGVVRELGGITGTEVPSIDAVYACCRLLDHLLPGQT